jgi:hypothetical protein
MYDALKSALKEYYRQKRKDTYIVSFQQKQGRAPSKTQMEALSAIIKDEDLEKEANEAIIEIQKIFTPSLLKKVSLFVLPTAFSFAFLAASISLVCLELHYLKIFIFDDKALNYFLSYPMLFNGVIITIASAYFILASLKK